MNKEVTCGHCKSDNVFGMSRVVGYYSIIENWNDSKTAELVDRQKGRYMIDESDFVKESSNNLFEKEELLAIVK